MHLTACRRLPAALTAAALAVGLLVAGAPPSSAAPVSTTFTGAVSSDAGPTASVHQVQVTDLTVPITVSLDWATTSADLNVFLVGPSSSTALAQATGRTGRPETLSVRPPEVGTYRLRVKAAAGGSTYTLTVGFGGTGAGTSALRYASVFGYKGPAGLYAYGVEHDATSGTLLVSDYWNYRVKRFDEDTGRLLDTFAQGIGAPYDVEVDPQGHVWVAFQEQSVVAEYAQDGTFLRTIGQRATPGQPAGCGGGRMDIPTHVLAHPNGRLYVSDPRCRQVHVFDRATGQFLFGFAPDLSDLGTFTATPRGIDADAEGNVYVAELNSRRIVVFSPDGTRLRVFDRQADLDDVRGLKIDRPRGLVYVGAAYRNSVMRFTTAGAFVSRWDTAGPGGPQFDSVRWAAPDGDGNVYVGDTWAHKVWRLAQDGTLRPDLPSFPEPAQGPPRGGNNQVNGIGIDPATSELFTVDTFENRGQRYRTLDPDGRLWSCRAPTDCPSWVQEFGSRKQPSPTSDGFSNPRALTVGAGRVWADGGNAVVVLRPDGGFVDRFGSKGTGTAQFTSGPKGIVVDPSGSTVWATDAGSCRVLVLDADGDQVDQLGTDGCGTGPTQMSGIRDLDVDLARGLVYVADAGRDRITVWDRSTHRIVRTIAPVVDGRRLSGPRGVKLSPDGTSLYVADTDNARVVRTDLTGGGARVVSTGADTPEGSFGGPDYLAWDPAGRLYVSDDNQRVYVFTVVD